MDAIFDENFTSLLSMLDLLFHMAIKMRRAIMHVPNTDTLTEVTGSPTRQGDHFPNNLIVSSPYNNELQYKKTKCSYMS